MFLIVPKYPANVAARFGVVYLRFCCPNRTNQANACFAVCQQARKPLLWQLQCVLQAHYGEYFCFLSCPSILPTLLHVLVWCICVFVVQIAQTKPKFACFAVRQQARKPLLWQLQCALQAHCGEYFCFLSCPSTLPTLLHVLVWCICVFVV